MTCDGTTARPLAPSCKGPDRLSSRSETSQRPGMKMRSFFFGMVPHDREDGIDPPVYQKEKFFATRKGTLSRHPHPFGRNNLHARGKALLQLVPLFLHLAPSQRILESG